LPAQLYSAFKLKKIAAVIIIIKHNNCILIHPIKTITKTKLCTSFIAISQEVWNLMRRAYNVQNPSLTRNAPSWGMQLKETTLTDYIVLRLLEECSDTVSVFTFSTLIEAKIGADMELWITDKNKWIGLRIQCKIADRNGEIKQLHYKLKNNKYQCDILIQQAKSINGCIPIYLVYSNIYTNIPLGNWFISLFQVRSNLNQYNISSFNHIPWHCIVCCPENLTIESIFKFIRGVIDDQNEINSPVESPPEYVRLALENKLPEAEAELRRLLEGHEMHHLAILDISGEQSLSRGQ